MPSAADMLLQFNDINQNLINDYLANLPPDLTPEERLDYVTNLIRNLGQTGQVVNQLSDTAEEMREGMEDTIPQAAGVAVAKTNIFSLSKIAQAGGPSLMNPEPTPPVGDMSLEIQDPNQPPPAINQAGPNGETLRFRDAAELRDYLNGEMDVNKALQSFLSLVSDERTEIEEGSGNLINPKQVISDAVKTYFEGKETMSDQEKLQISSSIFEALPESVKAPGSQDETLVQPLMQQVASVVDNTNRLIREAAIRLAKNHSKKSFNLKKIAQHKSFENTILVGPGQTRIDAFTGNLISDLHLIERNKGYGLKVDDVLNIDWETIWRGSVMDKYSREYRDKDGNWVGGYLNKRFEIDRFVPVGNDYQLKPGQRRHPRLPEYGNIGSRLEHAREKGQLQPKIANKKTFNLLKSAQLTKEADGFLSFIGGKGKPTPGQPTPAAPQQQNQQVGFPVQNKAYQGPQPNVDFKINERVRLFNKSQDGRRLDQAGSGKILSFQGSYQGVPQCRIKVDGESGIITWPIDQLEIEKSASSAITASNKIAYMKPLGDAFSTSKEEKANSVSTSKTCPSCQSTNDPGQAVCENCGMSLAGIPRTYHPHSPSPKGEQKKSPMAVVPNQRVAQYLQQTNPAAQPMNNLPQQRNPADKRVHLSDPHAENLDEAHLSDVKSSADSLGL